MSRAKALARQSREPRMALVKSRKEPVMRDKCGRSFDLDSYRLPVVERPRRERDARSRTLLLIGLVVFVLVVLLAISARGADAQESPAAYAVQIPPCDPRVLITIVTNRPLIGEPLFVCHPVDDDSLVQQVVVRCQARHTITQAVVTIWELGSFDGWVAVYLEVPCGVGNFEGNSEIECNSSESGVLVVNSTSFGSSSQPRFKCSGYLS